MTTPALAACLECHAPLTPADTGGLCPKCLLKLGLATQLAGGNFAATAEGLRPDGSVEEPFNFGNYRILRLLGKGGMGAVYEAEQNDTGRRVALKVLGKSLDSPEMRQRFLREGQLAASVRHSHVVSILGAEEIEETPVIVMELLHDGTLKDRVTRRGPLPIREAVDAVLQIIEGLEAAHAVGVLHRDVKPANCFSSNEGLVKVGDFGLSISTLAKAEQSLTKSGAVLGTPAFAAPEQLRGEEIDARADIYAVGATLYFLLTGKPAFEADSLVALIAAVLEKRPTDVRAVRPEVPRTLGKIVMRCLDKDRSRRARHYAALRAALIPYSSAATTPAMIGLRFVAGALDSIAVLSPFWIATWFGREMPDIDWLAQRTPFSLLVFFASVAWMIVWYAVPEALWGRSPGKWVCGLRVVRADGSPIGWGTAFTRSTLYSGPEIIGTLLGGLFTSAEAYRASTSTGVSEWLWPLVFFAYWVTMRRSNGFAAIHDLLTRSRVVLDHPVEEETPPTEAIVSTTAVEWGEPVGPFHLIRRDGNVGEAFDPALRRRVWVQYHAPGTPALPETRHSLARGSRLRWLLGRRSPEENWDVFDQPDGQSLPSLASSRQPWSRVRVWLADLAGELRAGTSDGSLSASVSLAHVWITSRGRAVLLDFPAPGTVEMPAYPLAGVVQVQDFLSAAADLVTSPVLPMAARQFLDSLRRHCFEATAVVAGNLQALLGRPASVDRAHRALGIFLVPMLLLLVSLVELSSAGKKFDEEWGQARQGKASPRIGLELLRDLEAASDPRLVKVAAYLAQTYGMELVEDAFWQKPAVQAMVDSYDISRFPSAMMIARALGDAERAAAAGLPATFTLADRQAVEKKLARENTKQTSRYSQLSNSFLVVFCGYLFAVVVVLVFGIPMTTRLLGIAVVCADGKTAGRLRMVWRTFVAGLPVFVLGVLLILRDQDYFEAPIHAGWPAGALVASFALICLFSIAPRRALEDRLAGTWLVPR